MKNAILIITVLILKSCGNIKNTVQEHSNNMTQIINGSYNIIKIKDEQNTKLNLNLTFNALKMKVSGFSGCNQFSGTYTQNKNTITINNVATTRKLCEESINKTETKFLKYLNEIKSFKLTANNLVFYDNNDVLIEAKAEKLVETTIKYSAISRGFLNEITITKDAILVKKNLNESTKKFPCTAANWRKINNTLSRINLKKIPSLIAPSKAHEYDGAPVANLTITTNNNTYKTVSFDNGNPPKKIETLVKEILSIAKNVE